MSNTTRKLAAIISMFLLAIQVSVLPSCLAVETISETQQISEGETLVSEGGIFELGFFSPNATLNRYIGIWYRGIPVEKVVWVANRDSPLKDTTGVLMIGRDGNLELVDGRSNTIWSTGLVSASNDTVAVLNDLGNLVLSENGSNGSILWESFNHPSDTILPSMKVGENTRTRDRISITSWRTENDPSPGSLVLFLDPLELPEAVILNGTIKRWRSGQWNGRSFIGVPDMNPNYVTGFNLIRDDQAGTIYVVYSSFRGDSSPIIFLSPMGDITEMSWSTESKEWVKNIAAPQFPCDIYGMCGPFGICNNMNTPICKCLRGFEPKSPEEWSRGNWTHGCVRRVELQCENNSSKADRFFKLGRTKLPDLSDYIDVYSRRDCEDFCLKNCSCTAYAFVDGIGCIVWRGQMMDIQEFSHRGEELYLRLAHSELGEGRQLSALVIILVVISTVLGLVFMAYILYRRKAKTKLIGRRKNFLKVIVLGRRNETATDSLLGEEECSDLPFFSFQNIAAATDNFSIANKLGEGGFGPVYKGKLPNGQEFAVKRLAKSSGQGIEELKNEVILISKLQHRNLVKLLGFCIEGEEKLLLYEFMPNSSLDLFIFGKSKRANLDWDQRYYIIEGIARGLLYLHRDSRLRIIHRDLKASNILLDEDMKPKISDFGLARIFMGSQTLANTNRVVGTHGYMSPEYAMEGLFSEKSDVFSFGVLVLEIISSKRNTGFYHHETSLNLLGHVWKMWNEGKALELLDPGLVNSSNPSQVMRCIHVGLLCVQEQPKDRPTMATIIFMLCNDTTLPIPKKPGFILDRSSIDLNLPSPNSTSCSITILEAR